MTYWRGHRAVGFAWLSQGGGPVLLADINVSMLTVAKRTTPTTAAR